MFRIEVWNKPDFPDPRAGGLKKDISDLGIEGVTHVGISDVYSISGELSQDDVTRICREVLAGCWTAGSPERLQNYYAPYCVMHRAPVRVFSGRDRILRHYAAWRSVFPDADLTVDHVCSQPFGRGGWHVAARWSLAGTQQGHLQDQAATKRPVYLVGSTHWRVLDQRIIVEWTVFDELAMLAQVLDRQA